MTAPNARHFTGGSWDLRKDERRKNQAPISFPDRRSGDRRSFGFPDFDSRSTQNFALSESNHSKHLEKR
jgi:hypothetical protein